MRYVNLASAPLWECGIVAALSISLLVWRCWSLFEPASRVRSALIMAVGMIAYAGSVMARREAFGQGVALLALVAVSFWLASVGRIEDFAQEVEMARVAKKSPGGPAKSNAAGGGSAATTSVVRRLIVIACAISLLYWAALKLF